MAAAATPASAQSVPKLQFEKLTLPNGLQVILHEDHSTPIVVANTWYHVGSGDERPGAPVSPTCSSTSCSWVAERCRRGSSTSGSSPSAPTTTALTNFDRTNYYEQLPSNALPSRSGSMRIAWESCSR
jgi:zinc protease